MRYFNAKIEEGNKNSTFTVYYDSISSSTIAGKYPSGVSASNVTFAQLSTPEGFPIQIPDASTQLIIADNDPNCSSSSISGSLDDNCEQSIYNPVSINRSISGDNIYNLGGWCSQVDNVSSEGKQYFWDSESFEFKVWQFSGGSNNSCLGKSTSPIGTQVSSFTHLGGTISPTATTVLYDTGYRYSPSYTSNNVAIIVKWDASLKEIITVYIVCVTP
jgi:hypothetical protein